MGNSNFRLRSTLPFCGGIVDGQGGILIVFTDNQNVSDRLKSWKTKSGRASRMLQASIDYLIEWNIWITPRIVRIGRNSPSDHFPRAYASGINSWADRMGATQGSYMGTGRHSAANGSRGSVFIPAAHLIIGICEDLKEWIW